MENRVLARRHGSAGDALFLLEHDPVITFGRNAKQSSLLATRDEMERRGIAVRDCGRGGDVTYHGPGQLVGYPVIQIEPSRRDVHRFVRSVEEVLIRAAGDFGICAGRRDGLTGVWVGESKLASIGVRLARWVTSHGFALNVSARLDGFAWIVPCGIEGCEMTSVEQLLGRAVALEDAGAAVARHFGEVFDRRMIPAGEQAPAREAAH